MADLKPILFVEGSPKNVELTLAALERIKRGARPKGTPMAMLNEPPPRGSAPHP